jgi:rhodanese-related sulfurtransferase
MKTKLVKLLIGTIGVAMLFMLTQLAVAAEIPRMTKEELKAKIGNADHDIIIVDVRAGKDWRGSEFKIKGAVREDPKDVGSWINNYPKDKTIVLY